MAGGRKSQARGSNPWKVVLYFANAQPTPEDWQAVLAKPFRMQPHSFGVSSGGELDRILAKFREVLAKLANAPSLEQLEYSDVLGTINARAQAHLERWIWARGTGRVFPYFKSKDQSFEEELYGALIAAMTTEPITRIRQCRQCQRFFYEPRRSLVRLCSSACRRRDAKARAERYRAEHKDEYRDYQRKLMAKRRREGRP